MNGRSGANGGRGQRRGAGARPFAPGEAPPGVRPGLGGIRRRAGVTPIGTARTPRSESGASPTSSGGWGLPPRTAARLRRVVLVGALLAALLLPPIAARAGLARVGSISVLGTTLLDPAAVIAAANIPVGSSLLAADLRAAEAAVAALPMVESVHVSAGLPDRVQIKVRERALLLRWQVGEGTYAIDAAGDLLGSVADLDLAPSAALELEAAPLISDDRTPSPVRGSGGLTPTELDVATRLASLLPADLGTAATSLQVRILSDFGYVVVGGGPTVEWTAVFGIYSGSIRPATMIPGQVRLLRSLLAGREERIGWVILADDQAGTYTVRGVRPPSPSIAPGPSSPSVDPTSSLAPPTASP